MIDLQGVGWQGYFVSWNAPISHEVRPSSGSNAYVFVHGTGWRQAVAILKEGVVRPSQWTPGKDFPSTSFFCQASLCYLPEGPDESESLLQAVSRSISTPKGQSGIHIVGEAFLESAHSVVQGGGTWREMATARAAGVARAPERWAFRSDISRIRGFVITFPV